VTDGVTKILVELRKGLYMIPAKSGFLATMLNIKREINSQGVHWHKQLSMPGVIKVF